MFKAYTGASVGLGGGGAQSGHAAAMTAGPGGWHPTALYMLALVVGEIVAVGFLTRHLMRG